MPNTHVGGKRGRNSATLHVSHGVGNGSYAQNVDLNLVLTVSLTRLICLERYQVMRGDSLWSLYCPLHLSSRPVIKNIIKSIINVKQNRKFVHVISQLLFVYTQL